MWALRDFGALPAHNGALPQPQDGIEAAITAWTQVDLPTIIDADNFFPMYLEICGGDQARNRQGDLDLHGDEGLPVFRQRVV